MKYKDVSNEFKYKTYNQRQTAINEIRKNTKTLKTKQNSYYVYVYLHPGIQCEYKYGNFIFDYAPFYVGKGKEIEGINYNRLFSHLYYNNKKIKNLKQRTIEKIKQTYNRLPIIIKVVDNVSEQIAFDVENLLINKIGRIENSTGILTNIQRGHKTEWEKIYEKINK